VGGDASDWRDAGAPAGYICVLTSRVHYVNRGDV
jgi:hypothetical protein